MQMRLRCRFFPNQRDQPNQSLTCGCTAPAPQGLQSFYMITNKHAQANIRVGFWNHSKVIYMWTVTLDTTAFLVSLRSEEHTSELQSRFDLVCRLLLEKKNH